MPSLATRHRQPELMDSPDLREDRFIGSLAGLSRVNLVTGSARIVWPAIADWAARHAARPVRILDIACGAGDMLQRIDRRARRSGIDVELAGCDIKRAAIDYARRRTEAAGTQARFFELDAVRDPIPPAYDVIVCSLFLHHLDRADAVSFLSRTARATRGLMLIHDLERRRSGYLLASLGIRFLLCNDVCRVDGPASVRGAFTIPEVRELAHDAGLDGVDIEPRFPYRLLLRWEKP